MVKVLKDSCVKMFYLPSIDFYISVEKSGLTYAPKMVESMKMWFQDKCKLEDLSMLVEAGMSVAGSFAPTCSDEQKFMAMSRFVTYGYLFDDMDINSHKSPGNNVDEYLLFDRVVAAVKGEIQPKTLIEKTACEIYKELKLVSGEGPYKRHLNGFTTWVDTMRQEHILQVNNKMSFESFIEFRKDNGGYLGMTAIIEVLLDLDIASIWEDLKELYDEAYFHMMLTNDLYSFRKEYYSNDNTNIIIFLTKNMSYSLQEAVNKVAKMLNRLSHTINLKKLCVLQKFIKGSEDYLLAVKYCQALENMVAGNLLHSQTIARYHGANATVPVKEGLVLLDSGKTIILQSN